MNDIAPSRTVFDSVDQRHRYLANETAFHTLTHLRAKIQSNRNRISNNADTIVQFLEIDYHTRLINCIN